MSFFQTGGLFAALTLASATAIAASPAVVPTDAATLTAPALVARVLAANPSLTASRYQAAAAQAAVGSAGKLADPKLTLGIAPNTFNDNKVDGTRGNIQISQAFPWPGTLSLRKQVAHDKAETANFGYTDRRLHLAERTRAVYATWFYIHRALTINAENRTLVKRLRKIAETSYAAGQASQQDVLAAEVELARLDDQRLALKSRRHGVQARINALLDRAPQHSVAPPMKSIEMWSLPPQAQLQSMALATHPKLQALEAQHQAAEERVSLAKKAGYPQFKVFAGYNDVMDPAAKRPMVGVGFSIPLDRGKYHSDVQAASARRHASQSALAAARADWLGKLEAARAEVSRTRQSIALYAQRLLPVAHRNLDAARDDYRSGQGDFSKLILAERQYLQARLEQARNRADYFTRLAALDYRAGGLVFRPRPTTEKQP